MDDNIIKTRLAAIRRLFKKHAVTSMIVTSPPNVTYATGFMGDDSWALITARRVFLLTDSRYTEQARKECSCCDVVERSGSLARTAAKLVGRYKSPRAVVVEKSVSLADYQALKKNLSVPLKSAADIIETVRAHKNTWEISNIKKAASLAAKALALTLEALRPAMTESELAGRLDLQIRTFGATNSFDTIVAFGPNASCPHHRPGPRKLRTTDTILIDFGARYRGYCSDITRCFSLGPPASLFSRAWEIVAKAQAAAIELIKPGARIADVDAAPREVIRRSGLPVYGHGTGHGLGLEIHEAPFLKPKAAGTLAPGQIITIEPGIYIPGKLGVRIEDDVLVTDAGCRILTRSCPRTPRLSL